MRSRIWENDKDSQTNEDRTVEIFQTGQIMRVSKTSLYYISVRLGESLHMSELLPPS